MLVYEGYIDLSVGIHRGQKKMADSLELELYQ